MPAVRKFSRNFVSIPLWGTLSVMGKSPTYRFPFSQYPAIRIALFLTAGILLGDVAGNAVYSPVLLFGVMAATLFQAEKMSAERLSVETGRTALLLYLFLLVLFGMMLAQHRQQKETAAVEWSRKLNTLAWETVHFSGSIREGGTSASGLKNYRLTLRELFLEDNVVLREPLDVRVYSHTQELDTLKAGNNIRGELFLYPFPEQRNPHEFDFGGWLLKSGFVAQGRLEALHENDGSLGEGLEKWRNYALENIEGRVSERAAPLVKALVLGYKNDLSMETRSDFSRSGLAHIMAVSGMHVGFLIAPFWMIIPWLWQKRAGKSAGLLLVTLLLLLYAGITGFSPSVCRASLMLWLLLYGRLWHKIKNSINLAGVAVIILLLIDPYYLYDIGFQLSFGAVFTILLLIPGIQNRIPSKFRSGWRGSLVSTLLLSVVVQITLFPLLVYYFGEFSIAGPLANMVVLPLLPVTLPAGFVIAMAGSGMMGSFAAFLSPPIELVFIWIEGVANWFGITPLSYVTLNGIPGTLFLLWAAAIGFFTAAGMKPYRWKWFILACIALNLSVAELLINRLDEGGLEVTFLDVGQGDAIHISTPGGKQILIDAGRWSPSGNSGERVLIPYFKERNIDKLDALFITHPHADHIGGIPIILESMEISRVFKNSQPYHSQLYLDIEESLCKKEIPVHLVREGEMIHLDPSIRLFIVGPVESSYSDRNPNNHSVALKLVYGKSSFLFSGDAEERQERAMAHKYGNFLKSDVYKVNHHGSNTSSTYPFINYVEPRLSVTSLGFSNQFGHPGTTAVERLDRVGTTQYFTSLEGAVILRSDGEKVTRVLWK